MELTDLVNFVIILLSQMALLRWLTFLLGSQSVTLKVLVFWIYSFLLLLVLVPPFGNSDHIVVSVSIDFPSSSQQDALLHCIAYGYSCADWEGLRDHLTNGTWNDIFKLSAPNAARKFCVWVQIGMDVYIPHLSIKSSLTHLHGFQMLVLLP